MGAWSGPFLIAVALLATAGVAKAIRPRDTAHALRGMGLPVSPTLVRLGGVAEVVISIAAALTGDPIWAGLVAASYLAFTGFVVVALVRHAPISSCGCFGRADTPPSFVHIAVNLAAAVSASAVAVGDGGGIVSVLRDQPVAGLPMLMLTAVGVYATLTALTVLPQLERLRTESR